MSPCSPGLLISCSKPRVQIVVESSEELGLDERPEHALAHRAVEVPEALSLFDPQSQSRHFDELASHAVEQIDRWAHVILSGRFDSNACTTMAAIDASCVLGLFLRFLPDPAARAAGESYNRVDTGRPGHKSVG